MSIDFHPDCKKATKKRVTDNPCHYCEGWGVVVTWLGTNDGFGNLCPYCKGSGESMREGLK